jgi:UDP-N-acetylglucosamine 1-carboxyvinyltransferase
VWEKLGATVEEKKDYILVKAPGGFHASEISFPITTIGGTENALICASTIDDVTTIKNAYVSPEVEDLIKFLRSMGAKIEVSGNSKILIEGKDYLKGGDFSVMPDRIEAITWLTYSIISGGDITIEDVPFDSLKIPFEHIREAGVDFFINKHAIRVSPDCLVNGSIQPFEVATGTHPGVISDMQPFYVLMGLFADGISRVYDYRYPERVTYLEELSKFFPDQLEWESGKIIIHGSSNTVPKAAEATSTDLRGSIALILAALLADQGTSKINKVEMALRGYNNLAKKLQNLSVGIETR